MHIAYLCILVSIIKIGTFTFSSCQINKTLTYPLNADYLFREKIISLRQYCIAAPWFLSSSASSLSLTSRDALELSPNLGTAQRHELHSNRLRSNIMHGRLLKDRSLSTHWVSYHLNSKRVPIVHLVPKISPSGKAWSPVLGPQEQALGTV